MKCRINYFICVKIIIISFEIMTICDSQSGTIYSLLLDLSPFKYGPQSERVYHGDISSHAHTYYLCCKNPLAGWSHGSPFHLQAF